MTYIGSLSGANGTGGSSTGGISQLLYTPGSGLSGLASGINTDAMVNAMVQAAQVPLVHLLQQRQIAQWQEMRYQQVNASLSALQNSVFTMQLQSTFMPHTVASSNASAITGSASSVTPTGSYSVAVSQLAQGATVYSDTRLSTDPNWASNTTLSSLGYSSGVTLNINGQTFKFQSTDTLSTVLSDITSNSLANVAAFYDPSAGQVVMQTTNTGSGAAIKVDDATTAQFLKKALSMTLPSTVTGTTDLSGGLTSNVVIEINGQQIQLNGSASAPLPLSAPSGTPSIVSTINSYSSQTGVTASVWTDPVTGQQHLMLTPTYTDSTGTQYDLMSPISVDTTGDPSNILGLQSYAASLPQNAARDAKYTVNGYSTSSATNQVNYNGLTLNLMSTTSTPVSITVSTDVNTIVNSIENFVQQYNQSLQLMQGLYYEQRNYDYPPLTQQQASQLTQEQIEQWNEKAQSGMLSNDPLLGSIMTTLENDMQMQVTGQTTSTVNGQSTTLNSLASIGITPIDPLTGVSSGAIAPGVTTAGWNSYGLLQIDTAQLTAAVEADPNAVMRLFTNNPTLPGNQAGMGSGIAVQLSTDLNNATQQLTDEAGSNPNINDEVITKDSNGNTIGGAGLLPYTLIDPNADFNSLFATDPVDVSYLGQQINGLDTQATDMQQQISLLQTRYENEFSQMEQTISSLSSQSSFLSGLMGSSSSGG
ncbi:MAG: flagellar filament capping protein FliD [Alicyclobacillus sp.]|nr:flagellar filament capping protein FliD [Alicyclobacillus sp.]